MHVDRIEFDGFEPMDDGPRKAGPLPCDGADPDITSPRSGSVSLISRGGRLRVSLLATPRDPRRALITAIRQLLRMPEYRGGAQRLTFARTLPMRTRGSR